MLKLICSFVVLFFCVPLKAETEKIACAVYVDSSPNIRDQLLGLGCKAGDPILFYNHANRAKWNLLYSIRIAALSVCDLEKPITDSGSVGSQPYQSLFCTFSGDFRTVMADDKKYLKGWNWKQLP